MPSSRGSVPPSRSGAEPIRPARPLDDAVTAQLRLELAVDAAAIGAFDWDVITGELLWDDRMRQLMGSGPQVQPSLESFISAILPADRGRVQRASDAAIAGVGDLRVDFRIIDEVGATRWLTTRGRVIADGAGRGVRMVGVVFDSSAVHDDREQAARALDTMATAYAIVDSDWTVRYVNQAARVLVAQRREPVGTPIWDLVPGLANPSVASLLRGVMSGNEPARIELRAERIGGWLEISVQPVANGIAVLVSDVTARREAQDEAERTRERLELLANAGKTLMQRRSVAETVREGLSLLVPQLATSAMIYLRETPDAPLQLVDILHIDPVQQEKLRDLFAALPLGDDPNTGVGRAVASGRIQMIGDIDETVVQRATSDPQMQARLLGTKSTGVFAVPLKAHGEVLGFIGLVGLEGKTPTGPDLVLVEDITSRIASAIDGAQSLDRVERARAQQAFLASVADKLGPTMEVEEAAQQLAKLLVPHVADWSMVTLLGDSGRVEDIASFHRDASRQPLLDRYTAARRASLTANPAIIREVIAEDGPLFQLGTQAFRARLAGEPSVEPLLELDPGVVTALPIQGHEQPLGVISLYNGADRGMPTEDEMTSAREVARRAGLVLDNARHYGRSKSMAETLQRNLLPLDVPDPPGLELHKDYVAAGQGAQVGGDWYDGFQTVEGVTTLVIGDVMGHDTQAAALMGQLRTLVRAMAVDRGESPGAVLSRVDRAAEALELHTTATAVVAQVLDGPGEGRRLRWSNAGHPPPLLILADGTVRLLETPADLLLGLGSTEPRADHEAELPAGSTVVLFTDGLIEGRGQPLEVGLQKLTETAASLAGLPLRQLCEQLVQAVRPAPPEDDVAWVAVRVTRSADTPPER